MMTSQQIQYGGRPPYYENRILAISPRFIVRLTRNLVRCSIINHVQAQAK